MHSNNDSAMLNIRDLEVSYGAIAALHGISLTVPAGKIVTLIGANGAGKSTTLRAISGIIKTRAGLINFNGEEIAGLPPHEIVARGIAQAPEGRMIFANLTVSENLDMGAYLQTNKTQNAKELERVFTLFPRLKERRKQFGGTLARRWILIDLIAAIICEDGFLQLHLVTREIFKPEEASILF